MKLFAFATAALLASASAAQDIRLPDYQEHTLANGARVLLMEKHDVPIVALEAVVRGGSQADAAGKDGTAALLAELMQKGAGQRDAAAFAEAVDAVGGRLNIGSGRLGLNLSAEFLADDAALMVELAADALRRPQLREDEFAKVRERSIKSLVAAKDGSPQALIGTYGQAWLYGEHAYGRPSGGSEATLAAIEYADLTSWQKAQLGGDRLILVAVGAFKADAMKAMLDKAFGDWAAANGELPKISAKPRESGRRVLLVDKPGATQTYFWLGNVGVSRSDPQRVAQDLVNTLFGGRFTSMLNSELRVRTGLTYGAGSSLARLPQPGPTALSSFTRTDATVEAIDLAIATLERLHSEDFDEAMLQSGRNYVLGQFPPRIETAGQIAAQLGTLALYDLDRSEIDDFSAAVRAIDTKAARIAATSAFPRGDDLVMVLIGDAAKIREQVKKYGPVTEMPITATRFQP